MRGEQAARAALRAARAAGNRDLEAAAREVLGNTRFERGDFQDAARHFRMLLALREETGDTEGQAQALKNAGIAALAEGRYQAAMLLLERATERFPGWETTELAISILGNLGRVYQNLSVPRLALSTFQRALEAAQARNRPDEILDIQERMGFLYLDEGFPEQALSHLLDALPLAAGHAEPSPHAWLLEGLALAYRALGDSAAAAETLHRLLDLDRQRNDAAGMVLALNLLGGLREEDDPARARAFYNQALETATQRGAGRPWNSRAGLARLDLRAGRLDLALAGYREAAAELEAYRDRRSTLRRQADVMRRNRAVYDQWIDALMERRLRRSRIEDDVRVFQVAECARAWALLEQVLAGRMVRSRKGSPQLLRRRKELEARMVRFRNSLESGGLDQEARRRLEERWKAAEVELDEITADLRRNAPQDAVELQEAHLDLPAAQRFLGERTAIVAYCLTATRALAMVITGRSYHLAPLSVDPATLPAQVLNYLELLQGGRGWAPVSRRLYRELITPVWIHLDGAVHHLIFIPDGSLHALPFETLLGEAAGKGDGPLIASFSISYAPSVSLLAQFTRKRAEAGPASILLFADPEWPAAKEGDAGRVRRLYEERGLHLDPAPGSRREAGAVARRAGPGSEIRGARRPASRVSRVWIWSGTGCCTSRPTLS